MQRGLIYGQNFTFILRAPDLYTAGYDGFDNLPIPFRAVATDLVTGDIVVLDRGNLMRAVRASMAAPGAFPPVEIDGRKLTTATCVSCYQPTWCATWAPTWSSPCIPVGRRDRPPPTPHGI